MSDTRSEANQPFSREANPQSTWKFDPERLQLICAARECGDYRINLRSITSSACMLDAIFRLSGKSWASDALIGDLIRNLQELFDPQVTLCNDAGSRGFDPVDYLENKQLH